MEPLETRQLLAVIINELHVDPDISTEQVEFIEFYNDSSSPADVSNWVIDDAVDFTFPANTTIPALGYFVVAQDAAEFATKFGFSPDAAWQTGDKLSNEGETVQLRDANGIVQDEVDYKIGFPWPTVGSDGRSMELIHPTLPNDVGGSWRASGSSTQQPVTLLERGATGWSYRKGTSEASTPIDSWRQPQFNENNSWLTGQTPIGYGDNDDNTELADMQGNYTSVYLRHTFDVTAVPSKIQLNLYVDDGAAVWINGFLVGFSNVTNPASSDLLHDDTASNHEASWESFTINNASEFLLSGSNVIAVQALNTSLNSSDFSIDAELVIPATEGADPTPGAVNTNFSSVAPPLIRKVEHFPEQPASGEDVLITAKISDSDGVQSVSLEYQLVNPGSYLRITDSAFQTSWTTLVMQDDGIAGDAVAGDGIYSAIIPGSLNTHRRLIRYRLNASDSGGASVAVPYADDPQPNFAYFVYDGVPDYTASLRPGVQPTQTWASESLSTIATYHLIANATDVTNSQWSSGSNGVQFRGTIVYDGIVYDHIEFRIRGQGSTYAVGKNKWKLNFLRGHSFQARDDYGNRYSVPWDKMNVLPGTNPWWRNDVSTEGTVLSEPTAFKLYELAGAASPHTQYFQFRVIDAATEALASDQYAGDFWGLYIGIEQPDGRFLDERELPDGNIFNMHGSVFGDTSQRNQAADLPSDRSDLQGFVNGVNSSYNTLSSWQQNLDFDSYFAWNQINHLVNNSDIRNHENVNYYHNQESGLWELVPWDLDLTFEDAPHWFNPVTNREPIRKVRNYPEAELQYDNFLRNLQDLLLDNGDAALVVQEYANVLAPNGDLSIVHANQAQWDYHPRKNKKGIWYDNFNTSLLPSQTFAGLTTYMQDFVSPGGYGYALLAGQGNDSGIPNQPTLVYDGGTGYPRDELDFLSSSFADPNGNHTFAAMQWRLAEIHNSSVANYDPTEPYRYEIEDTWDSGVLTTFNAQHTIPASVVEVGKTYRVRVRMQDASGNWSHWSDAHEFQAAQATSVSNVPLVITEINYNPGDPTSEEFAAGFSDKDEFEFIELMNAGTDPVAMSAVQLQSVLGEGVAFDFSSVPGLVLYPGERIVVVENLEAFTFRYGTDVPVAGQWTGGLANGDELLTLTIAGIIRQQFEYEDAWVPASDNGGYTLQIIDGTDPDVENWSLGTSWQSSAITNGTPGVSNIPGDFDENGVVDAQDIDLLSHAIATQRNAWAYDLNSDGLVNRSDVESLIVDILETQFGDANLDGTVDTLDFAIWNAHRFQNGTGWAHADFNCDTITDASDFAIWNANRNAAASTSLPVLAGDAEQSPSPDDSSSPTNADSAVAETIWQNTSNPHDVNRDGEVTPLDALLVINQLNADRNTVSSSLRSRSSAANPDVFWDTNGDGELSPLDGLLVINQLNAINIDLYFDDADDED